jgi:hypothetical protein
LVGGGGVRNRAKVERPILGVILESVAVDLRMALDPNLDPLTLQMLDLLQVGRAWVTILIGKT